MTFQSLEPFAINDTCSLRQIKLQALVIILVFDSSDYGYDDLKKN